MKFSERMDNASSWILDAPESLVILLLMAASVGVLMSISIVVVMGMYHNWIVMALFVLMGVGAIKSLIKISKLVKNFGLKNALSGITAREFVWIRRKEDGNSRYKSDADGCIEDAERDGEIRKEIKHIYQKPK